MEVTKRSQPTPTGVSFSNVTFRRTLFLVFAPFPSAGGLGTSLMISCWQAKEASIERLPSPERPRSLPVNSSSIGSPTVAVLGETDEIC